MLIKLKKMAAYFSLGEWLLWIISVAAIIISFAVFDGRGYLTLAASLLGVTSLIFNAKGNPVGQALMIVFSIVYAVISYGQRYYGEMITYLGMTAPMSLFALVSWLKNPYKGNRAQVEINTIGAKEWGFATLLTAAVTAAFYFILEAFNPANIVPSTISVATSFIAVYLTFRRSPYFALGYAANDIVLVVLWSLASAADPSCISVVVCFAAFLVNDCYTFISWRKILKVQSAAREVAPEGGSPHSPR